MAIVTYHSTLPQRAARLKAAVPLIVEKTGMDALAIAVSRGLWVPDEVMADLQKPVAEIMTEIAAEVVAEKAVALSLEPGRTYESIHAELIGNIRAQKAALLRHIEDMTALLKGRV